MTHRAPPLNSLRVFEAAARHGSFVRAGAELSITAAAVSHHVRELEATLQIKLFSRLSRGVRLTDAGSRDQAQIAQALDLLDQATRGLRQTPIDGPLRISAPVSFAQLWLAPRLHRLSARYPGLQLVINADDRRADLRTGETDLAIRFGPGTAAGLTSQHWMNDAVSLLATAELAEADQPLAQKLTSQTLITDSGVGAGEPWMSWSPWLRQSRVAVNGRPQLTLSNAALALAASAGGSGICISRSSLALPSLQRRTLAAIAPWRSSDYAYYLVTRTADKENPRIVAVRRWLQRVAKQHADEVFATIGFKL